MFKKSFNCCVLSSDTSNNKSFQFPILSDKDGEFVNINNNRIPLIYLTVGYIREFMCPEVEVSVMRELKLWKVNVEKKEIKKGFNENDIEKELKGTLMEDNKLFKGYFEGELARADDESVENIHIITIIPATGKCLPMVYLSNKKFALSHIL
jgi:hypothetical protein